MPRYLITNHPLSKQAARKDFRTSLVLPLSNGDGTVHSSGWYGVFLLTSSCQTTAREHSIDMMLDLAC